MSHKSENCLPLKIIEIQPSALEDNYQNIGKNSNVYFLHLPTIKQCKIKEISNLKDYLISFANELDDKSVLCILSNAEIACQVISFLEKSTYFKLWVAIKRSQALMDESYMLDNHVSLTMFTKYRSPLKHNKTLIQYSYCPSCNKTTKDYGGKKHLYSPLGTLMSDVWRDISYSHQKIPQDILERIKDLFGLEPYQFVYYIDLQNYFATIDNNQKIKPLENTTNNVIYKQPSNLIKSNLLINDDCLNYLRLLPNNSIDFVFADPPYNIQKKYDIWNDCQDNNQYIKWCIEWVNELARVLKNGKTLALLNIPIYLAKYYEFSQGVLEFQNWIVWESLSLPVRQIMPAHYGILCLGKGEPEIKKISNESIYDYNFSLKEWYCIREQCIKKRNKDKTVDREPLTNIWWDIHRLKHNSKRVDHPCQLPPTLMKRILTIFTEENDLVLDPFNGSGTTTLVASIMNRRYIGIEISEQYHSLAEQRHTELENGVDPFAKRDIIPKAKNSRVNRIKKQKYDVSKKTLQLEVRDIAVKIGRKPTREDIEKYSQYPFRYFDEYFADWGEVCSAVGDKGMQENKDIDNYPDFKQLELPFE